MPRSTGSRPRSKRPDPATAQREALQAEIATLHSAAAEREALQAEIVTLRSEIEARGVVANSVGG